MTIHKSILAAVAAVQMIGAPAFAQIGHDPFDPQQQDTPRVSASAFLRLSFGGPAERIDAPSFGLGFYQNCTRTSFGFDSGLGGCGANLRKGFELSSPLAFDGSLTLRTTGPLGRRNLLGWAPETGAFGFAPDGQPQSGGIDWTWVAIGVATVGAIVIATEDDDDEPACPTNTVRNPQTGQCQSIAT
ncbi:MAG: hypothetical protein ABMA14_10905 [Hyphomonadaceae bacterium]